MSETPSINDSVASTSTSPFPPRYRWLKRIAVGTAGLLVALVALRLWWGHVAYRPLQAEIDRILAAGEPLFPEDFEAPFVPDDRNAAVLLLEAVDLFQKPDREVFRPLRGDERHAAPAFWAKVEWMIANNAETLDLVRRARDRPEAFWRSTSASPMFWNPPSGTDVQYELAAFLCSAAEYFHRRDRHTEAVETLRDALAVASALAQVVPDETVGSVLAIRGAIATSVETIVSTLIVQADSTDPSGPNESVPRTVIQALIADLLEESTTRQALLRDVFALRMRQFAAMQAGADGRLGWRWTVRVNILMPASALRTALYWPVRPIFWLEGTRLLEQSRRGIDAARTTTWVESRDLAPSNPVFLGVANRVMHPLADFYTAPYRHWFERYRRAHARTRMAAVALALRLYALDHGQPPVSLEALVPEYLPEVPADPFGREGQTIGYLPHAEPPRLYSVGVDGVDNGGAARVRNGESMYRAKDMPFFLEGVPPDGDYPVQPAAPTSKPFPFGN